MSEFIHLKLLITVNYNC